MSDNPTPRTEAGKRLLAEYQLWFTDQGWEAEGWDPEASAIEMARAIIDIEVEAAGETTTTMIRSWKQYRSTQY
jgi:hypothetical protein